MNGTLVLAALMAADPIITVTVDGAIDDADQVKKWVETEGEAALNRAEVDPAAAGDEDWAIDVQVRGETYDYKIAFELKKGGELLADQPDVFLCECSNDQLIQDLKPAFDDVVALMETSEVATDDTAGDDTGGDDTGGETVGDDTGGPVDDRKIGGMGIAGATLMGVGVVAVIAGAVVFTRGSSEAPSSGNSTLDRTDYRPPGQWTMVGGGVAFAIGLPLLIADLVIRKKRRRAQQTSDNRGMSLTPRWSDGPGVSLEGRF